MVDGAPADAWRVIEDQVGFLSDADGRCIGFQVNGFGSFDPEAPELDVLWTDAPHFDAPLLGLRDASAGAICVAARVFLGDEPTLNRCYFNDAVSAGAAGYEAEAAELWALCLETGDAMAHYGLGYTLYALGDFRGAYRHLRVYTELTPHNAWSWCWLGRVCIALGELDEARSVLEKAVEMEAQCGETTGAPELLEELDGRHELKPGRQARP